MRKLLLLTISLMLFAALLLTGCDSNTQSETTTVEEATTEEITTVEAVTTVAEETTEEATTEEVTTARVISFTEATPTDGVEVVLINEDLYEWYQSYSSSDSYGTAASYETTIASNLSVPVEFAWTTDYECSAFTIAVATKSDMSDAVTYDTTEAKYKLDALFVATDYYWQVTAHADGNDSVSPIYTFKTADTFRLLNMKNIENARDIGGRMTSYGIRLKQGMVYRSARLDNIKKSDINTLLTTYGIKTHQDLRGESEMKASRLGDAVNFVNTPAVQYQAIFGDEGVQLMKQELLVFTDSANYPVIFHCAGGRDRTGILAFLLEALCGVSELDMTRDYEASLLPYKINTTGDLKTAPTLYKNFYEPFIKYFKDLYKSDDLKVCAERYMTSIGLTSDQINNIRANLLGDGYKRVNIETYVLEDYKLLDDQAEPVVSFTAEDLVNIYGQVNPNNLDEPVLNTDGTLSYATFTNIEPTEGFMYLFKSKRQMAPIFMAIYRTENSGAIEVFTDSVNTSAKGGSNIGKGYTKDGEWHYLIIDLEKEISSFDGISASYLRLDIINGSAAGQVVDLAYVGIFTSVESAENYAVALLGE